MDRGNGGEGDPDQHVDPPGPGGVLPPIGPAQPLVIQVENLVDLMPEAFTGQLDTEDCEEFFQKFVTWLSFHPNKFPDGISKVNALTHCLSKNALDWWNEIPDHIRPHNMRELERFFYRKFRTAKTRTQLKTELNEIKYVPRQSCVGIINKFQAIASKLDWPLPVQLEKFIRTLPVPLRQFVVSRNIETFDDVSTSIRLYQEMVEAESISSVFKNVTFLDEVTCGICGQGHNPKICPLLRSMVELEVSTMKPSGDSMQDNYRSDRRSRDKDRYQRNGRSPSPSSRYPPRYSPRDFSPSRRNYSPYRGQGRSQSRSPSPNYRRYRDDDRRRPSSRSPNRFGNDRNYNPRFNFQTPPFRPWYRRRGVRNYPGFRSQNNNDGYRHRSPSPKRYDQYSGRQYDYDNYDNRDRGQSYNRDGGQSFNNYTPTDRPLATMSTVEYPSGTTFASLNSFVTKDGIEFLATNRQDKTQNQGF